MKLRHLFSLMACILFIGSSYALTPVSINYEDAISTVHDHEFAADQVSTYSITAEVYKHQAIVEESYGERFKHNYFIANKRINRPGSSELYYNFRYNHKASINRIITRQVYPRS